MKDITFLNDIAARLISGERVYSEQDYVKETMEKMEAFIEDSANNLGNYKKIPFLPLNRLNSEIEIKDCLNIISEVVNTGYFTSGPYLNEIESAMSSIYNATDCIATSSGTDALMIALKSCNVGSGDEVIVPPNSFAATENAIFSVGAKPKFIDIDSSFNIDPRQIERNITNKTKAIMPVCLYGSSRNIEAIYEEGKKYNLSVIVDAAQCFGLKNIINYSDIVCLSFNPFKNIGTFGKSGALLTNSEKLASIARSFSYHGFKKNIKNVKELDWGYNSRMDNMQAAILMTKLKYFPENAMKRSFLAHRYLSKLKKVENMGKIQLPIERRNNTWHLFPIILKEKEPTELIEFAKSRHVEFDIYYPVLGHKYNTSFSHEEYGKTRIEYAEKRHSKLLHIPLHNHLSISEQDKVIEVITSFYL